MMLESLESRRMFSRDLYWHDVTLDGEVAPGETALLTFPISNAGTEVVTQPFFVEGKLVRGDTMWGPANTNFYDPNAVALFKTQIDFDVPGGPAGYDFSTTFD